MSRVRARRRRGNLRALLLVVSVLALAIVVFAWISRRDSVDEGEITTQLTKALPEGAPSPELVDVTAEVGLGDFRTFDGPRSSQLPEDMGAGLAWGDYDRDGDDDLLAVASGGRLDAPLEELAPTRLYENLGGRFRPSPALDDQRLHGMAAAWGDVDGDGWLDLVISGWNELRLFRNVDGRLQRDEGFASPEGFWSGLAFGDFDGDGDLDLYVGGYVEYRPVEKGARAAVQYGNTVPFTLNPAAFEAQANLLLVNDGSGNFVDRAVELGVDNPGGRSLQSVWHDFDLDGDLDLYVANDVSDNALFLNHGDEGFESAGERCWVSDYRGAMGLAVGDWNRDGDDDLFISHWIAQENALFDNLIADGLDDLGLAFTDMSAMTGLGQASLSLVGWGSEWIDLDADGWLDLVVVNGSTFETETEPKTLLQQSPSIWWSDAGERFHDLAPSVEALVAPRVGRGLAVADYDLDGDLDLAINRIDGGIELWRNDMASGHALSLRLEDSIGEDLYGFADHATVTITHGEIEQRRTVSSGSYLSQSSHTLHFGLGPDESVDRIEILWPDGEREIHENIDADWLWIVRQGADPQRQGLDNAVAEERKQRAWSRQREARKMMQQAGCKEALPVFEEVVDLFPKHGDGRFHLALCLAEAGRVDEALAQLERLTQIDPHSHRGFRQWAVLRAANASSRADLDKAADSLKQALKLNREETGAALVLGEVELMRGRESEAERILVEVSKANHQSVGSFFLRAFLAHRDGDEQGSVELLEKAVAARTELPAPLGMVNEGDSDVSRKQGTTPLASAWESWDGEASPAVAFVELESLLAAVPVD